MRLQEKDELKQISEQQEQITYEQQRTRLQVKGELKRILKQQEKLRQSIWEKYTAKKYIRTNFRIIRNSTTMKQEEFIEIISEQMERDLICLISEVDDRVRKEIEIELKECSNS